MPTESMRKNCSLLGDHTDQKPKDINYWSKAIGNSLAIVSFKNKGKNKDLFKKKIKNK